MTNSAQAHRTDPLAVGVIVGSTRPNRNADRVVAWLLRHLEPEDMAVDLIDLRETGLSPVLGGDEAAEAGFAARIAAADAFIVVTPEYNHGYPASLKHAIDSAYREWNAKPVAFVSYGGMSGGLRAVEQLRQVFAEVHAVTTRDGVAFPGIRVDSHGVAADPGADAAAKVMLDQLAWWGYSLRDARDRWPYAS